MSRFVTGLVVTVAFAAAGWAAGGVTLSGAAAGLLVAFALYSCAGVGAFLVLFAVFALTWIATRVGYERKQQLGIAERRHGRRNAGQVLANIGVSGACGVIACFWKSDMALVAAVAALTEAAADTVSSECGEAWSNTAYSIIGFRAVPAGTDGAITTMGTSAGFVAATITASVAAAFHAVSAGDAVIAGMAGIVGMIFDSVLGATVERRDLLNNNGVNFSSTMAAGLIAAAVRFLVG